MVYQLARDSNWQQITSPYLSIFATDALSVKQNNSIGFVSHDQPQIFFCASIADLVDGDGESWLDVSLHIFLPVVAEKACSF